MKYLHLFEQHIHKPIYVYHGSPTPDIEFFKLGVTGNGIEQEGPGIYFTDRLEDTYEYGEFIYEVELTPRRLATQHTRVRKAMVQQLLQKAPDIKRKLMDWGDPPRREPAKPWRC